MKSKLLGGCAFVTLALLLTGCSGKGIEIGPVPSVTPRAEQDARPTATPLPKQEDTSETENKEKRNFKEQYEKTGKLPSLAEVYKDQLQIGLSAEKRDVTDPTRKEVVNDQFSFISCKTELSAASLLDYSATRASGKLNRAVLDFTGAKELLDYAMENGKAVRGPVLISHEMPDWFFTEHFSESEVKVTDLGDGKTETKLTLASADVMLARMENYIKDVMEYCNVNYPEVVISWDVVGYAVYAEDRLDRKLRNSAWYQTIGPDYILRAFEYADNYRVEGQKLYYRNDALDNALGKNEIVSLVRDLKEKTSVDGFTAVIAYNLISPNVFALEDMLKIASQTGLEVHLESFCSSTNTANENDRERTEEENLTKVAKRYKALMGRIEKAIEAGECPITSLSFEGLSDDQHKDNQPKEYVDRDSGETVFGVELWNYGYLFDKDLQVKEAFFGALQDDSLKGY